MQDFPHHYSVVAKSGVEGDVTLEAQGLPAVASAAPAEFGGPGNRWSPETLLVGAVADCFILTFRAVAQASKFSWISLRCDAEGTLDRVDRVMQFTGFVVRATLRIPAGTDEAQAERMLARSEKGCLISNSLKADARLETKIEIEAA
jgi:peroxiredoxin-like protein